MVETLLKKNWKLIAVLVVFAICISAWQADRKAEYRRGRDEMSAEISAKLKDSFIEQAKQSREKEKKTAAAFVARQIELEKEKQDAEKNNADMRVELNRLRAHAASQSGRRNLPTTTPSARTSDGEEVAKGWQLLGECASKYAGMAEVADQQRNDLAEWQAYGQTIVEADK
nr:MAG TPA: Protein of unknown function (DUF2514) [Caudoviricetes sp.]